MSTMSFISKWIKHAKSTNYPSFFSSIINFLPKNNPQQIAASGTSIETEKPPTSTPKKQPATASTKRSNINSNLLKSFKSLQKQHSEIWNLQSISTHSINFQNNKLITIQQPNNKNNDNQIVTVADDSDEISYNFLGNYGDDFDASYCHICQTKINIYDCKENNPLLNHLQSQSHICNVIEQFDCHQDIKMFLQYERLPYIIDTIKSENCKWISGVKLFQFKNVLGYISDITISKSKRKKNKKKSNNTNDANDKKDKKDKHDKNGSNKKTTDSSKQLLLFCPFSSHFPQYCMTTGQMLAAIDAHITSLNPKPKKKQKQKTTKSKNNKNNPELRLAKEMKQLLEQVKKTGSKDSTAWKEVKEFAVIAQYGKNSGDGKNVKKKRKTQKKYNSNYDWKIDKIIGKRNEDYKIHREILLHKNNVTESRDFHDDIMDSIAKLTKEQLAQEILSSKNRVDCRHLDVFTIDPTQSRDFDDALSVETISIPAHDTIYRIGIHIADVTHFLKQESILDAEALRRATTVYIGGNEAISMLPEYLSHDICSLQPNQDRLSFSLFINVDSQGNIYNTSKMQQLFNLKSNYNYDDGEIPFEYLSPWFGKTTIHSKARLNYETTGRFLQAATARATTATGADIIDVNQVKLDDCCVVSENNNDNFNVEQLYNYVCLLNTIAKNIKQKRIENGAGRFEHLNFQFMLNDEGLKIYPTLRGDAQFLVEEMMLLANRTVAEYLFENNESLSLLRKHHVSEKNLTKTSANTSKASKIAKLKNLDIKFDSAATINDSLYKLSDQTVNIHKDAIDGEPYNVSVAQLLKPLLRKEMRSAKYTAVDGNASGQDNGNENDNDNDSENDSENDNDNDDGNDKEDDDDGDDTFHFGLKSMYYTHFTSPIRRYADVLVHRLLEQTLASDNKNQLDVSSVTWNRMIEHCNDKHRIAKRVDMDTQSMALGTFVCKTPLKMKGIIVDITKNEVIVFINELSLTVPIDIQKMKALTNSRDKSKQILKSIDLSTDISSGDGSAGILSLRLQWNMKKNDDSNESDSAETKTTNPDKTKSEAESKNKSIEAKQEVYKHWSLVDVTLSAKMDRIKSRGSGYLFSATILHPEERENMDPTVQTLSQLCNMSRELESDGNESDEKCVLFPWEPSKQKKLVKQ